MITLPGIRGYATALPEFEETTYFELRAFKVRGKDIVVVGQAG